MYVPTICDGKTNIVKPTVPNVRLRSNDNGIGMQAYHFKTETYKHYFTNRIVYSWNTLPYDIRSTGSFCTFNTQLKQFYNDLFGSDFSCSHLMYLDEYNADAKYVLD